MVTAGKRVPRHAAAPPAEIPEALWREAFEKSWVATGLRSLHRYEADQVRRRLRIAEQLEAVLAAETRRGGPLPWPYHGLAGAIRRWARADRDLARRCADRWQGLERRPGRESRLVAFVLYLLKRYPDLPRAVGPWLRACDRYGSPEPRWVTPAVRATWDRSRRADWDRQRRDRWKPLLRRVTGSIARRQVSRPR
jgi:hypothetical protein